MTYTFPLATPFSTVALRRDLHRLLEEAGPSRSATAPWQPAASVREDATGFTVELDLPGVEPGAVEVIAEDGTLTIRGGRAAQELADGEKAVLHETPRGTFVRRFRMPKSADQQAVSASYALGVLTVRIAKLTPAQPRRVPVTVQTPTTLQG